MKGKVAIFAAALTASGGAAATPACAQSQIERGKYLVTLAGCGDCHTPGYFRGKPDAEHPLSGSDVGFAIPGLGVFVGRNLTPDKGTGLGGWTDDQIVIAITTGQRPDGRELAPIMPSRAYAYMAPDDLHAIIAYLRALPPTKHVAPGPFAPDETPSVLVSTIVPGDIYAKIPKP